MKNSKKGVTLNETIKDMMEEILSLMLDCVSPDNIENEEVIVENLDLIYEMMEDLPRPLSLITDSLIERVIFPIIDDEDYFDFIYKNEELGKMVDGVFVAKDEAAIWKLGQLFYERCELLERVITDFGSGIIAMMEAVTVTKEEDGLSNYWKL